MLELTPIAALRLVLGAESLCIAISTAELIACGDLSSPLSFHAYRHLAEAGLPSVIARRVQSAILVILVLKLAAAIALLTAVAINQFLTPAVALLWVLSALLNWYKSIGGDGAEQMSFITLTAAALTGLVGLTEGNVVVLLTFVAAQSALAYLTAGVAKLASPTWRSGSAISGIVSATSYGSPLWHRIVTSVPSAGLVLCWSTMLWEALFPIALLGHAPSMLVILILGVCFHAGCAIVMGLNDFFWAFVGTYPAIIVVAGNVRALLT